MFTQWFGGNGTNDDDGCRRATGAGQRPTMNGGGHSTFSVSEIENNLRYKDKILVSNDHFVKNYIEMK